MNIIVEWSVEVFVKWGLTQTEHAQNYTCKYLFVLDSDSDSDIFISPQGGNSVLQPTHPIRVKLELLAHNKYKNYKVKKCIQKITP